MIYEEVVRVGVETLHAAKMSSSLFEAGRHECDLGVAHQALCVGHISTQGSYDLTARARDQRFAPETCEDTHQRRYWRLCSSGLNLRTLAHRYQVLNHEAGRFCP